MTRRISVIAMVTIILALCTGTAGAYQLLVKEVTVIDNNVSSVYKTTKLTVEEFLAENEIVVEFVDRIEPVEVLEVTDRMTITIKRAVPVTIVVDGKVREVITCEETVKDLLAEQEISVNEKDLVTIVLQDGVVPQTSVMKKGIKKEALQDQVVPEMKIQIQTYREEIISQEQEVSFETEVIISSELEKGKTNVVSEGTVGTKENTFKVIYIGGKETSRQLIKEEIIKKPVNHIIEEGTARMVMTSRDASHRYTKMITMTATAYTASFKDTGKRPGDRGFGITASGMKARYGVIAVDPKVIPLGTRLYVEGYGLAIAGDTGGAIKGNKIDLYFDTSKEVTAFGRQKRDVYILDER
jgi:uncharacterized protein YabE (DUF348 family)